MKRQILILTLAFLFFAIPCYSQRNKRQKIKNGLKATYFKDKNFGDIALERTDHQVNFLWGSLSPDKKVPIDHFSVRWEGTITTKFSEEYTLHLISDNGVTLWIDDQLVIHNWKEGYCVDCVGRLKLGSMFANVPLKEQPKLPITKVTLINRGKITRSGKDSIMIYNVSKDKHQGRLTYTEKEKIVVNFMVKPKEKLWIKVPIKVYLDFEVLTENLITHKKYKWKPRLLLKPSHQKVGLTEQTRTITIKDNAEPIK